MLKPDLRLTGSLRDVRCATSASAGCSPAADYDPNGAAGPYTSAGNGADTAAQPPCFPTTPSSDTACIAGTDVTEVAQIPGAMAGGTGTTFEGSGVRVTDSGSGPGENLPRTVVDLGIPIPIDCLPTPTSADGSTCGVNTTANALYAGIVQDGNAAVWQIGEIELEDSGPDGVRGNADDEVFAVQGVFVP